EGRIWSVSINPFLGDADLIPNGEWLYDDPTTSIIETENTRDAVTSQAAFTGVMNNQINLQLPEQGNYTVQLFDLQGRLVNQNSVTAAHDNARLAGMSVDNLTRGMYILRV
ncbi:T9SS type A sorting domain-containing protein, partial [Chitinivibrio alkaliphilus]|uniref:T9SS type A sorting domain-containing protein n=1 Tax=Chitinivibrio alkaliphilus TaxID=1505232 RepID=UPI00054E1C0F